MHYWLMLSFQLMGIHRFCRAASCPGSQQWQSPASSTRHICLCWTAWGLFLQSFWMVALPCHFSDIPPSLVSHTMLLRVLTFNHQSLMKLLNSFSIDPWGASCVTRLLLVFELLITVIWAQHSRQCFFLQAVLQSSPYFPHLASGIQEEAVLKALLKSR